ncbi:MAG: bifunctional UDP-N-acetylglucosamine diphosphorylase/glucosamine-1-phosphate N-acetyltransferase GlmU [Nitrospirae bacterium]|nr:bifunctional UDP-N-acetylglucosamine diphosphorylase/glucosamine-1-phosphate N-acetyltransferase GlmU [Nitrospirota bacterium]
MKGLGAIVMAAGLGKRMRSKLAKVLHPVAGRPMVLYAVELAERLTGEGVAVVVGYQGEQVQAVIESHRAAMTRRTGYDKGQAPPIMFVQQEQQLGTGHAVMQARAAFARAHGGPADAYVILNGDTPLLTDATVQDLLRLHEDEHATVTMLTAILKDPTGYGRVVRHKEDERVLRIVEDRDATPAELRLREINAGTYVVNGSFLFEALDKLEPQNVQKEYYLTDIVGLAVERGLKVAAMVARDAEECLGINSRQQLAVAEQVVRRQIRTRWMQAGVTLHDPDTTWIDAEVDIGRDTVLYPHVTLEGRTTVGEDCVIRSHTRITDSVLGHRVMVQDCCVIREARLEENTTVGPFAHLRPGSVVRRAAKVGNFVEMKKADLGEESKANHLSYLGDARIGKGVNIGSGTITCNYDGFRKHETVIEDEVFVGSDAQLIAPVTVGRGAVVAAGSTLTQDVPPDALAIGRAPQVNRPGWAARRRALQAAGTSPDNGRMANPVAPRPKPLAARGAKAKKRRKK